MNNRLYHDLRLYRIVVAVMVSVVGAIVLTLSDESMPDVIITLGSIAFAGLVSLLASSPLNQ